MKALPEIKTEVTRLALILGASEDDLPTYEETRDFAYPHIEVDGAHYHYVVVERGQELERKSTTVFDELLYWIFASASHRLAFSYELKNRVENQDCRRIAFPKQVELLGLISPCMATRRAREIEKILASAPYTDEPSRVVNFMRHPQET